MNERIEKLVEQADTYAYKMNPEEDSYGRPANPRKFQQERDAKFAELIVAECMNKIEQAGTYFNTQPQYTDAQNKLVDEGFTWGVESCQVMVKQHFGVE